MKHRDFVMPFGKHIGKRLEDTPLLYLDYILTFDLHDSTREAIEGYLKEPVIAKELDGLLENERRDDEESGII